MRLCRTLFCGMCATSSPSIMMDPESSSSSRNKASSMDDLPLPVLPQMATFSPALILSDTWSIASRESKPLSYDAVASQNSISPRDGHSASVFSGCDGSISCGVSISKSLMRARAPRDVSNDVHELTKFAKELPNPKILRSASAIAPFVLESGNSTPNATRNTARTATYKSRTRVSHL